MTLYKQRYKIRDNFAFLHAFTIWSEHYMLFVCTKYEHEGRKEVKKKQIIKRPVKELFVY